MGIGIGIGIGIGDTGADIGGPFGYTATPWDGGVTTGLRWSPSSGRLNSNIVLPLVHLLEFSGLSGSYTSEEKLASFTLLRTFGVVSGGLEQGGFFGSGGGGGFGIQGAGLGIQVAGFGLPVGVLAGEVGLEGVRSGDIIC